MKMIKYMTLFVILFGFGACQLANEMDEAFPGLVAGEGKLYEVSSKAPHDGVVKDYYEDGTLKKELHFEEGKRVLAIFYYENGDKQSMVDESGEGMKMTSWYENGQKEEEFLPGSVRLWYPNGQIKAEVLMDDFQNYHGEMRKWSEEGTLLAYEIYEAGELVEKVK